MTGGGSVLYSWMCFCLSDRSVSTPCDPSSLTCSAGSQQAKVIIVFPEGGNSAASQPSPATECKLQSIDKVA